MNDNMLMGWLEHRLTPAFQERSGQRKVFLALDNAKYRHCFDLETEAPESSSKQYDTTSSQRYGVVYIDVPTEVGGDRSDKTSVDVRVEASGQAPALPRARSKHRMSTKELTQATRALFTREYPSRVVGRVEASMDKKG